MNTIQGIIHQYVWWCGGCVCVTCRVFLCTEEKHDLCKNELKIYKNWGIQSQSVLYWSILRTSVGLHRASIWTICSAYTSIVQAKYSIKRETHSYEWRFRSITLYKHYERFTNGSSHRYEVRIHKHKTNLCEMFRL